MYINWLQWVISEITHIFSHTQSSPTTASSWPSSIKLARKSSATAYNWLMATLLPLLEELELEVNLGVNLRVNLGVNLGMNLTLIFAKSKTIWDIIMKISALLQLRPISILTKFQGHSSKIGSATPIWNFRRFWREILILGTNYLDFWYKAGFHRG